MRVFLDTNVLVSAFATRGLCTDLYRLVLAEHELASSEYVLDELHRVLTTKLKVPHAASTDIVSLVRNQSLISSPTGPTDIEIRDPDDVMVLAAALSCAAQTLVTGDRDLLELPPIENLEIVTPRGFWEGLR